MKRPAIFLIAYGLLLVGGISASAQPDYRTFITSYCATCHNQKARTAGLTLDTLDLANVGDNAEIWEKVVRKVKSGMMPPQGMPRADQSQRSEFVSWLETRLDMAAAAKPNPGRPLLHRLNRAEYANAIRDLLDLEVDAASLLPPDDSGYGFDNNADVLGVSPVLLERYLSAAGKISALAVGDRDTGAAGQMFRIRQDASQDQHIEGLPLGTIGGMIAHTTLPLDGTYLISVKYFRTNLGAMRGLEYRHQIEITVDGQRVHLGTFGSDDDFKAALQNPTMAADSAEARSQVRVPLKAGSRSIGIAFLRESGENTLRLQPFIRSSNDTLDPTGHAHIDSFTITGPFDPTGPGDTPSRRRIFICKPVTGAGVGGPSDRPLKKAGVAGVPSVGRTVGPTLNTEEPACARKILSTLARKAYRGMASEQDTERLMQFFQEGHTEGTFENGIELALERMLASPKFVFRAEQDPANLAAGSVYRISDLELASRLSFFLWSSIPDEELLNVASRGQLKNPAVLEQQVRRMLADPRSDAIVSNFAGQWLYLRNLRNQVPNSLDFPDFDDNLRQALLRETELFFGSIMHEDRNVLDLMTADYTFVNERLAKHYGIPNINGSHFRRVTLTDDARHGLLGKGSILMVTSHTDRTSPVVRGKWILENLLGAPPPPPLANAPPLKETSDQAGPPPSMRARMEEHRANPVCSGCHAIMDPIGFALENFDAVGAWRTHESRVPIDASGQLLDGTKINGAVALRQALLRQPEMFVSTLTEKLMMYALGRGTNYYDMPEVRSIVRQSAQQNYRFSSIVMGIVKSTAFQMRVKS